MLTRLRRLNQRGDTIVEVLIVLAVVGLALGLSYSTANRSLLGTRSAEENSQATALLQGQLEDLRSLANSTAPSTIFNQGGAFCINSADNIVTGGSCQNLTTLYKGKIQITYQNNASNPDTFTLVATWPDAQGQGNDTVTLVARIHKMQ